MASTLLFTAPGLLSQALISSLTSSSSSRSINVLVEDGSPHPRPVFAQSQSLSLISLQDYRPTSLRSAFEGVDIVIHETPSMHPSEEEIGKSVIDAARQAGVSHFILCTSLHPFRMKLNPGMIK